MDTKEYIEKTKESYKSKEIAEGYKKAYSNKLGLRNARTKAISSREQKIVKDFVTHLKNKNLLKDGANVLDVPVGTGKMTRILLDGGFKVTCGDISEEMMAEIDPDLKNRENYTGEGVADAAELSFEDNSFDLVVNIRLLHRVDAATRKSIIKEAKRVSKNYCIMSFGKDNVWHSLRIKLKEGDPSPGREKLSVIKNDLEEAGFKIIKKRSVLPVLSNEVIFLLNAG